MNANETLEILSSFEDVEQSFESLSLAERKIDEVTSLMENACRIYDEVKQFGYTDITCEHLKAFESLSELINLSTEKIIKYKATEGLGQAVSEGIKRFIGGCIDLVKRVMEFLSKLFNTFSNKCRTLLMNLPGIQFDKKVQSMAKDKMTTIVGVTKHLSDELERNRIGLRNLGSAYFNHSRVFMTIASNSHGLLSISDDFTVSVNNEMLKFEEMTLADGKWSIGDCRNLITSYMTREKTYTTIGSYLYRFLSEYLASGSYGMGEDGKNYRRTMRLDCALYSMLSKIQHIWTKQIMAFYKCLGPTVRYADGDEAPSPQLAYQPA